MEKYALTLSQIEYILLSLVILINCTCIPQFKSNMNIHHTCICLHLTIGKFILNLARKLENELYSLYQK